MEEKEDKELEFLYELKDSMDRRIKTLTGKDVKEIEDSKTKVLLEIYKLGGTVNREQYHKIGKKSGYSNAKALGGLHAWRGKGATVEKIEKLVNGEYVEEYILTKAGLKHLKEGGFIKKKK